MIEIFKENTFRLAYSRLFSSFIKPTEFTRIMGGGGGEETILKYTIGLTYNLSNSNLEKDDNYRHTTLNYIFQEKTKIFVFATAFV